MQNVSGLPACAYQLCLPENLGDEMKEIGVPGTHGSGTQLKSAIGKVCYAIAHRFMSYCCTSFEDGPYSDRDIANLFARVLLENPATFDQRSGMVKSRPTVDYDKKPTPREPTPQAVGRAGHFAKPYQYRDKDGLVRNLKPDQYGIDYRRSPYFLNEVHAGCFRRAFKGIYSRLRGYAARKLDQYAAQKVSHLRGGYSTPIDRR